MKAIYVTVDALLPVSRPEFSFLSKGNPNKTLHKLKAAKIRNIFSMGLLVPCDQSLPVDKDMMEELGITKWEPIPELSTGGDCESDPGFMPVYTDIESYRKHKNVLQLGEEVYIYEKIHGANGRFSFNDDRLWVGSHRQIKKEDPKNMWWRVATEYNLGVELEQYPGYVFYGEVYGQVQDLKYETGPGELKFALFDIMDSRTYEYLDAEHLESIAKELGLPLVPLLYKGPWNPSLEELSEGQSTIANHIREGFVVRPAKERKEHMGRVILKLVGNNYLLRKE